VSLPKIKKTIIDEMISMQDVQDAIDVLCEYAMLLDEYNDNVENTAYFADRVKTALLSIKIFEIWDEWCKDLESGKAFYVFGFDDEDMQEEHMRQMKEGRIAELDSLQKELMGKTLHIIKEDTKRKERCIKVINEIKELLLD